MTYQDIEFEVDDPVAVLRLNRPDRLNAFTHHTLAEIRHAVAQATDDVRVVGIVITGGGLILALMSDLRFAAESARFTTVFLQRGLIAEHGSSWLLPRLTNVSRALDLLWMSEKIDARQAESLGLVDRVLPDDELLDYARGYVTRLAATSPPAAIAETKRLIYRHLGTGYREALTEANEAQNRFVVGPDAVEGARAFLEKRAPRFRRLGSEN